MANMKVVAVFLNLLYFLSANAEPRVKVSEGHLSGHYMKSGNGRPISAFTGIPYAEPPIGDLRFDFLRFRIRIIKFIPI